MPRGLRSELPDGTYHVVTRGVAGTAVYLDDRDRRFFLDLLAKTGDRARWRILVYCLMTTHYHLLVEASRVALSMGLHRLNGVYAQRFNRRHRRHGHLFGDRFSAWLIRDEKHFAATCQYILNNPVRAGICKTADEWRWSGAYYLRPQQLR
jgi:putative transposase